MSGMPRKIGQRLLEQADIAGEQRTQDETRGELTAFAQVTDERANLAIWRDCGERYGRLLAGFLGDPLRPALVEPSARYDKACKRLGKLCNQLMAGPRRNVISDQHGFADCGKMTKTCNDAIEREWRDRGLRIFDQDQTGFGNSDLGNGGRHCARET